MLAETATIIASAPPSSNLRSSRSATAPTTGPRNGSGSIQSTGIIATSSGEPVIS